MLRSWLGRNYDDFVKSRESRAPFAAPGACTERLLFDWGVLDGVLRSPLAPDVLVVQRGELLAQPAPRTATDVRRLFARGAGVVVRRAERHDESLAALARAAEGELGGRAHLQLFVTPAQTHGFGWHYDAEDVSILQTVGSKTYYFRANTQSAFSSEAQPDFTRIKAETSPIMTATLAAGDMLYLPRGMWHVAKARTDSFSISVGVR